MLKEGNPFFGVYQKFEPVYFSTIKVDTKENNTNIREFKEKGFKVISFKEGRATDIIQAIPKEDHSILTFNTVHYTRWRPFIENSLNSAKILAGIDSTLLLHNIGVMFVDEFYFTDTSLYNPEAIFNTNSEDLPANILESDLTDFNISNHKKDNKANVEYMENLSIQVFNDIDTSYKVIRVTGNIMSFIAPVPFKKAINDDDELVKLLNFGHDKNKDMLKSILSKEALNLIGL